MVKKPLSKTIKNFWGIADFGETFVTNFGNVYFTFFLTDVAQLPIGYVSLILMAQSIIDNICSPFIGAIITASKPGKWGKYRTYLLICPPISMLLGAMMWTKIGSPVISTIVILVACVINIFVFGLMYISTFSLIDVCSSTDNDRAIMASNRYTGNYIGRLVSGYALPVVIAFFTKTVGLSSAYAVTSLCCGALMIAGYYGHFAMSKGYDVEGVETAAQNNEKVTVRQIVEALVKNPPLLVLIVVDMTSNVGSFLLPALAVYFYQYVVGDMAYMSIHLLTTSIMGLMGAYSARYLAKKFHPRTACLILYPFISLAWFSCRFFPHNPAIFIAINGLAQLFVGMTSPLESTMYMDVVVYDKWRSGKDSTGFIMGLVSVPVKLAIFLKSAVLSATLIGINYTGGMEVTPKIRQAFINAYTLIPPVIPLLGFVLMTFCYKLTKQKVDEMRAEIAAREAQ